ncbi:MAG: hypothetical protein AB1635_07330 [Acidobacteriota bacterium]
MPAGVLALALALAVAASAALMIGQTPRGEEPSILGLLRAVASDASTFRVASDAGPVVDVIIDGQTHIRVGARRIPAAQLSKYVGRRLKVRYRTGADGRIVARLVTVDRERR